LKGNSDPLNALFCGFQVDGSNRTNFLPFPLNASSHIFTSVYMTFLLFLAVILLSRLYFSLLFACKQKERRNFAQPFFPKISSL